MGLGVPVKLLSGGRSRVRCSLCSRGICSLVGETSRDGPVRERQGSQAYCLAEPACPGSKPGPALMVVRALGKQLNLFGPSFFMYKMGIIIVLSS